LIRSTGSILISFFVAFAGCDRIEDIEELRLPAKNPISYEFGFSLSRTKEALREVFSSKVGWRIEFATDTSIIWGEAVLRKPENANDAYIRHTAGLGTSRIYIWRKGGGAPYFVSHHIHITPQGENKTRVDVIAVDPEITVGVRFPYYLPFVPSVPDAAILRRVLPSTIEEYEILLVIGMALGVEQQMPKIILPEHPTK
jgi:hypothetical protein